MADLVLQSIIKHFGETRVLDDISLRVPDGSFTILLGASGCGKSTLLRIIAGLAPQTSGHVLIDGQRVDQLPPRERDIAMVFQHYALYPHLSVRDNLAFGLRMRRTPPEEIEARLTEAARLLDIEPLLDRKPRDLSGGQRQRVAMGRAIVRKPKLFLFDEPLSNLDAQLRSAMRLELKRLHERLGATIIYVTHDQVEAMTLGDTIALLDRGRLRQCDTPQGLYRTPADPVVAGFLGTPPMNLWQGALRRDGSDWIFESHGFELVVPTPACDPGGARIEDVVLGIRPEDVSVGPSVQRAAPLDTSLEIAEDLGSDLVLHLRAGVQPLIARAAPGPTFVPRQSMRVFLPHRALHLFVAHRRIDWLDLDS